MSILRIATVAVAFASPSLAQAQNCYFAAGGYCMSDVKEAVTPVEWSGPAEAEAPSAPSPLWEDRFIERVVQRGPGVGVGLTMVPPQPSAPPLAARIVPTPTPSPAGDPEDARRGHPCPYSGFADPS